MTSLDRIRVLVLGELDAAARRLAADGADVREAVADDEALEELIRESDVLIGDPPLAPERLLEINAGLVALVGDDRPRGVEGAYAVALALYRRDACCGTGRVIV